MANGEFIEILSPSALADLNKLNAALVETIASVKEVNTLMGTIKTPSDSHKTISDLNAKILQQEKLYAQLQTQLEKYNQSVTQTKIKEEQLIQTKMRTEAAYSREAQKLIAAQNLYNKTQQQLTRITAAYNDLAARKERYNNLNDNEEKRLITLQKTTEKYGKTLSGIDGAIGKYTRNVGNYASGFNPLSNSINQLTREAPAFANSIQTGFMALSNNIPIFFDAMKQASDQTKELQKQGKPTQSVLSQLASSFFSWQTVLSVGVTLLTIYGDEIVKWISGLMGASKAIDAVKESQKQLSDATTEGMKNAVQEQVSARLLLQTAKDVNLSYKERKIAVDELQSQYPFYFENLSTEQIMAGDTAKAERDLNNALLERAKSQAALNKITENQSLIIDKELEADQIRIKLDREKASLNIRLSEDAKRTTTETRTRVASAKGNIRMYQEELDIIEKQISAYKTVSTSLEKFATTSKKASVGLDYRPPSKKGEKVKREDIPEVVSLKMQKEAIIEVIPKLEAYKKALEEAQRTTSETSNEWKEWQFRIDVVTLAIDRFIGKQTEADKAMAKGAEENIKNFLRQEEGAERYRQMVLDLQKATDDWLGSFSEEFLQKSGLGSIGIFFDKTFAKLLAGAEGSFEGFAVSFNAIAEVAQETFNLIDSYSQKRFDAQKERLEKEKDLALKFTGESEEAKAKIEAEYDAKRNAILRKEAEQKKRAAIFNIIVDTAQAIMGTFAKTPPPAGIPFAVALGAIGAAQVAMVMAQEVPQYYTGTDNAIGGLAWVDERGQEIITDKHGNVKDLGSKKGARLKTLEKGDKVYNTYQTKQLLSQNDFNSQLSNILSDRDINMPIVVNSGLSAAEMDEIMAKHLGSQPQYVNRFDKKGFSSYIVKNGNITKRFEDRGGAIGMRF